MSSKTRRTLNPSSAPITEARVREIVQRLVHPAAVITDAKPTDPSTGNTPSTTARQNTFLLLTEAAEAARQLAARVCNMADRIAGSAPANDCATAGEGQTNQTKASSLVASLDDDARYTLQCVSIANEAVNRIERELP